MRGAAFRLALVGTEMAVDWIGLGWGSGLGGAVGWRRGEGCDGELGEEGIGLVGMDWIMLRNLEMEASGSRATAAGADDRSLGAAKHETEKRRGRQYFLKGACMDSLLYTSLNTRMRF